MTRQSKNATRKAQAKMITAMHLKGEKGPSSTQPKHGKRFTYRGNPDTQKRIAEAMKASQAVSANEKLLSKAGGAAK